MIALKNKAFIDTLHSYCNAASHASPYSLLQRNVTSSIKPEVHNAAQFRQRRTEPRPQGICTKIRDDRSSGSTDVLADRHIYRQTDRNTLLPYRGGVIKKYAAAVRWSVCAACTLWHLCHGCLPDNTGCTAV